MERLNIFKQKSYFDIIMFSMVAFYPELYKFIWIVFVRLGLSTIASNLKLLIWAGIILVFFHRFSENIKKTDILIYAAIALVLSVFCFYPWHYAFTWDRYFDFIIDVLPFFIIGRIYRYDEEQKSLLMVLAAGTLCLSIFYTYFFVIAQGEMLDDSMFASYNILFSVLMLVSSFFERKNMVFKVFAIIGISYIFVLGTRGPILCIGVFVIIMLIKKFGTLRMVVISCATLVLLNMYISSNAYSEFLDLVSDKIEDAGFSTRILSFMQEEDLTSMSGRDKLQQRVIGEIKKFPFEIRGPYSDWIMGRSYNFSVSEVENEGVYVHNLFLEMWANYGVIFGSVVSIFILLSILRLIIKTNKKIFFIAAVCVCGGFVKLMLSSSYLLEESFFFLMGLCFNTQFVNDTEKITEQQNLAEK